MYVACRDLKLQNGRMVKPGQAVPEAEGWDETVLRAHLNLEWIKKVEGEKKPETLKPSPVSVSTSLDSRHTKKKRR